MGGLEETHRREVRIPTKYLNLEARNMLKVTRDTYETHTHDGMAAKIVWTKCHFDARAGIYVQEEFNVEIDVSPSIELSNTFDTLYGARSWIIEQFGFTRSLLILKHSK